MCSLMRRRMSAGISIAIKVRYGSAGILPAVFVLLDSVIEISRQDACAPSEKDAGKMAALSAKKMQARCLRSQRKDAGKMPALPAKRCRQDACAPSEKMQARCL